MAGLNVACLLVGSSLVPRFQLPPLFFFFRICFVWKYMDGHVEKLIYNFGHYSTCTAESFPWGRFFFPVWFAGRGLGWLWIKNIWIKFSRGVGGGSSPRCKKCVSILVPGWKEETLSPWIIPLHDFLIIIDTSALEPTSMPTKK